MIIHFKYESTQEFILSVNSTLTISGNGSWEVDELDLALEFMKHPDCNFKAFISSYFWIDLDVDPDCIEFNNRDYKELEDFCLKYKEDYED